jgi:hypothetical protein
MKIIEIFDFLNNDFCPILSLNSQKTESPSKKYSIYLETLVFIGKHFTLVYSLLYEF